MFLIKTSLDQPERASTKELIKFKKKIIEEKNLWRSKNQESFVFLCGANITTPEGSLGLSKRREAVISFAQAKLQSSKIFLAENIFTALVDKDENLLDIEKDLLNFADYVVIVLESESTFCELGAFAYDKDLRQKLIIINNEQYRTSQSFINLGPIKAIASEKEKNILHYTMAEDGRTHGDRIGDIFPYLHSILKTSLPTRSERIQDVNPGLFFNKDSAMFLSDLIYLLGPLAFFEINQINKFIFGTSKNKILSRNIAMLNATSFIKLNDKTKCYKSILNKKFFDYRGYDVDYLMASFKNLYYKSETLRYA